MKNYKLKIILLAFTFFLIFPLYANAALIINRPLYIGLTDGLVGYWSFDGPDMADVFGTNSTANTNPSSGANNSSYGSIAWNTPGNITASDNARATTTLSGTTTTNYLSASDFGFSIPGDATITGITVTIERVRSGGTTGQARDNVVKLVKAGTVTGNNKAATGTNWPTSEQPTTYGGASDLWGTTWTPDDINVPNFGVVLAAAGSTATTDRIANVDNIMISITYNTNAPIAVTVIDSSGQSNNASSSGTNIPQKAIGKIGQALSFDGNDEVRVPYHSSLNMPTVVSLSVWLNIKEWYPEGGIVGKRENYFLSMSDNVPYDELAFVFNDGSDWRITDSINANIQKNSWYHVVTVFDETTDKIDFYINGTLNSSPAQTFDMPNSNSSDFLIGYTDYPGEYLTGSVDDVRVYNRVLSPDEIKRLYNIGSTFKINKPAYTGSLTSGLVGYWSFDGPDMAGDTAYDRSGQGNHGTTTPSGSSGPQRIEGKIGQALEFSSSNASVNVGTSATYNFTTSHFSFSFWIKPEAFFIDNNVLSRGSWNTDGYSMIMNENGGLQFYTYQSGANQLIATVSNTMTRGQWTHLVFVRNGSSGRFYINGAEAAYNSQQSIIDPATANRSFEFGNIDDSKTESFDDVRIYNRVLSSDEIKRLYNIGSTFKINKPANTGSLTQGLVGYWSFDGPDMAGDTVYDRSGQGNSGTLTPASPNGPQRIEGKIGQGLDFRGISGAALELGAPGSLANLPAISISMWIYLSSYNANDTGIFDKGEADRGFSFYIDGDDNVPKFAGHFPTNPVERRTSNTIPLKTWVHVVATWDGSQNSSGIRFYLNGSESGYSAPEEGSGADLNDSATEAFIGDCCGAFQPYGIFDDVRIYNRVLSANEIKRLYNMGQ